MSVRIISGTAKGRRLPSLAGRGVRPTSQRVRGAIFSLLGPQVMEGARVLDLFAGTGALGIEALSRGAAWVDFVEGNARQCDRMRDSLKTMAFHDRANVYHARVEKALNVLPRDYDLVLMDPPYAMASVGEVMERLSQGDLLREGALVVMEHSSRIVMEESYGHLKLVKSRRYGDTEVSIYSLGDGRG